MSTEKRREFFESELHRVPLRNEKLSALFQGAEKQIAERESKRVSFATACMDERTANIEEALGLVPGEGYVYGSGGARLSLKDFDKFYSEPLRQAAERGAVPVVYFTTHRCSAGVEYGCAAFKSDIPAQEAYFRPLQEEFKNAFPEFKVHVLMHDTKTNQLEVIVRDDGDQGLQEVLDINAKFEVDHAEDFAHAAYGVYVGDAYRAWVENYNEYFRLAADNQNLASDLGIAFAVMLHHSTVNLDEKPIIVHVDYPKYESGERTARAAANMDTHLKEALRVPEIAAMLAEQRLRVVKTETDMSTWIGKSFGEPEFND